MLGEVGGIAESPVVACGVDAALPWAGGRVIAERGAIGTLFAVVRECVEEMKSQAETKKTVAITAAKTVVTVSFIGVYALATGPRGALLTHSGGCGNRARHSRDGLLVSV